MERNMSILLIIAVISVVISGAVTFMGIQATDADQQSSESQTDQSTNSEQPHSSVPPAQTAVGGVVKVSITQ